MIKSTLTLALISLAAFGWRTKSDDTFLQFKEESVTIEYTTGVGDAPGEAVIVLQAETETGLDRIYMRSPNLESVLRMSAGDGYELALSGFVVETLETTPEELGRIYGEGVYELAARTVDGQPVLGSAVLSHELLPAPVVHWPAEGAVNVPNTGLVVSWTSDPATVAHRVSLEQDENDGLVVQLPASANEFRVPDGFLAPGTETQVEVGAVGANGNTTLVEVVFSTR